MEHTFYRQLLSAVSALAIDFTAVCAAVAAAAAATTGDPQTLDASQVEEMLQTAAPHPVRNTSTAAAGM